MSRETQNSIKLFMEIQSMRSFFDADDLPWSVEKLLNAFIYDLRTTIETREKRGE